MKQSLLTGISFGITSGIITTLGLMVGLSAGTGSEIIVIGGILTIAIADAFSDALGIHLSEESRQGSNQCQVWEATLSTFFAKFLFALTFIIPILLFDLSLAVIASSAWGILVLTVLSYFIARNKKENPWKAILEHLVTATVVITLTHFTGLWIASTFA